MNKISPLGSVFCIGVLKRFHLKIKGSAVKKFHQEKKGSVVEEEGIRGRFENQRAGPIFHLEVKETGDSKVVSKMISAWRTGLRQDPLCSPQLSIYTLSPIYLLRKPSLHSLCLDHKTATSKEILFSNIYLAL